MTAPKPTDFIWNKLKKGDIVGAPNSVAADAIMKGDIGGNVQIHHKTYAPISPAKEGKCRIVWSKAAMYSNIIYNQFTKEDGTTSCSLKTFLDIYGNYEKRGAQGQCQKDELGEELLRVFELIDDSYCESIDADPAMKKAILASLKFGANLQSALAKPLCADMHEPTVKQATIEDANSPDFGMLDMSQSPTAKFQLWTGVPRDGGDTNTIFIGNTRTALFTKIYNHTHGISDKPMTRWSDIKEFVYVKGDSKQGKRPFRLKCIMTTLNPSWYVTSDAKKGRLQYKVAEMHILDVDYMASNFVLPEEQKNSIMDEMMLSRNAFQIERQKPVEEVAPEAYVQSVNNNAMASNKRGRDNAFNGMEEPRSDENPAQAKKTKHNGSSYMTYDKENEKYVIVDADGNVRDCDPGQDQFDEEQFNIS